jgi:hypothetical protein
MRLKSQLVWRAFAPVAAPIVLVAGTAAVHDDLDVGVPFKALDEELVELGVLARNDEEIARSRRGEARGQSQRAQ